MVFEKVKEILMEKTDKDASEITMETSFSDLGIDSLDIVEMSMDLEDAFGIELEVDEKLATVGDLVKKIEELKA